MIIMHRVHSGVKKWSKAQDLTCIGTDIQAGGQRDRPTGTEGKKDENKTLIIAEKKDRHTMIERKDKYRE